MASRRLASAITLSAGTKINSALGSTNFLMSHGQATRSTLTRSRVIQRIDSSLFPFAVVRTNSHGNVDVRKCDIRRGLRPNERARRSSWADALGKPGDCVVSPTHAK